MIFEENFSNKNEENINKNKYIILRFKQVIEIKLVQ